MNKKTVILLSTTMMSIATAACAFCIAQTANAAEASAYTISGASTAKVTTPPPVVNSSFTDTDTSKESSLKTEGSSKKSEDSEISENGNAKSAESTNSNAKTAVRSETSAEIKNETVAETGDNSKLESSRKSDDKPEPKSETAEKNDVKPESKENSSSLTIFNQALFASGKPDPNSKKQEKTELKVSLCWETMNGDNKKSLIKSDSDFGQLNFENWDFGSTLDSSRKDVKEAFSKIKFQIKDTTENKVVATTTGIYDPDTATSATKSLGSYDSSHTYEVSVVNNTIPSPYYVTYNNVDANESTVFKAGATSFTWTPSNDKNKQQQNKYFRLNVLEIVYAKDESVAAKCFSYTQPKKENGDYRSDGDWKFTYNADNVFARLRVKDNKIQFPSTNPVKPGYKFAGWQFYVAKKSNGYPYTSYDRMDDDSGTIIKATTTMYSPLNDQTTTYPYLFAVLRDSKGVNTFGSKLGTQYCSTNHTFVVFPLWKVSGHTVTFMNGETQYAQVKVQEGKTINSDEWTTESMPADPTKAGFTFNGWYRDKNGTGDAFTGDTVVSNSDMTVYASYVKEPSPTPSPTPEPTPIPEPKPEPKPEPTPTPTPELKPEPTPTPAPEPDVMPEPESIPVPDVPYVPDDSWIPVPEIVPENPEYSVVEQPVLNPVRTADKPVGHSVEQRFKAVDAGEAYNAKAPAKHLPDTGVSATSTFAISIVSLFVGFSSFLAGITKRKN